MSQREYLISMLPDIGEGLKAALETLHDDPHPAACEMAAMRLDGARRHCQQLAEAVRSEVRGEVG
ncbi:MAG: hypothetical protein EOP84_19530 [Verrucomicrobiaceae bacterium]|nr:MAG: hypothetical protein EOP84_19530 [Verrucomicrobiaceae bacterium]